MYFVMIDRFADGDPTNNAPVAGVEAPGQYQGGDFAGLTQKIDEGYFNALGINTLWITSPLDNADNANPGSDGHAYTGYHGYWPKDLDADRVQARHRGRAQGDGRCRPRARHPGARRLRDEPRAHATARCTAQHPDWFWPNDNGNGGNCVCGGGCSWDTDRLRCWFDNFLPDFNFQNADARKYSVDNAVAWAKRIGIDGFRLDAVKHIETVWLTDLRARVNAEVAFDQRFYMVGETFDGDREIIKSYVNPNTMLDGQFDFPLRGQILVERCCAAMARCTTSPASSTSNDGYYGAGR